MFDMFGEPPAWQKFVERTWNIFLRETNLPAAIALFIVCGVITYLWKRHDPDGHLWPHMGGVTMEVFFVLIIFAMFEYWRNRREANERQREIIDDYKRWDSPDAAHRIAGAARRLNRSKQSKINFSGLQLSGFSFSKSGIGNLEGSVFYDGSWGEPFADGSVILRGVSFDHVKCRGVVFSSSHPFDGLGIDLFSYAQYTDCTFVKATLRESVFNGATLSWANPPPQSLFEEDRDEDTGEVRPFQVKYGPFDGADLTWASFRGVRFANADFRGADGLATVDFYRATGLDTAFFDSDEVREKVLQAVKQDPQLVENYRDLRKIIFPIWKK